MRALWNTTLMANDTRGQPPLARMCFFGGFCHLIFYSPLVSNISRGLRYRTIDRYPRYENYLN